MKKIIMILILGLLVACNGNEVSKVSFRDSTWGMSIDEVKESEQLTEIHYENEDEVYYYLDYQGKLGDHDARIGYLFDDGKLVNGYYSIEKYENGRFKEYSQKELQEALNSIKETLEDKYGEPTKEISKDEETVKGITYLWKELDNTVITLRLLEIYSEEDMSVPFYKSLIVYYDEKNYYKENYEDQESDENNQSNLEEDL